MTRRLALTGLAGLMLFARGAWAQETTKPASDATFVSKAASSGAAEVEAAKMALRSSQTNEVKAFAQRMINDHSRANQQLLTLAGKKQIPVPKTIDAKCQQALDKLSRLQGSEFDKAYAEQMVKDHKEAVSLFEDESRDGKDAELKAFAAQTLPTLKEHLKLAQQLNGQQGAHDTR